ncbi:MULTISPECIES: pyridoxamine 5'-phosphate oxidase family protein [Actinoplanes]|uniref:pyridoxamine 5'-phosphate oxidase family protein n=1 Tax=Actinoplanes TaxID=1865 RepID=UPI0005F2E0EC|nr:MULTISPECIES: pyridoxamine 5'-phosphate oxidase family protein [Actinoplanes]GLY04853.1 pyridoxamine 5'-phosphate oxidase [Actinoplanes sp. NBRC 101535]
MARWEEIETEAPEFAARVRALFDAGTNKTIATLRRDGAPRISAIETRFADGELTFGMMGDSLKMADLRRDPRLALHSPTLEPPADNPESGPGDAKLSGRAWEIPPPPDDQHEGAGFFRVDIDEVALTYVGVPADHLVIESWHTGRGHHRRTRA